MAIVGAPKAQCCDDVGVCTIDADGSVYCGSQYQCFYPEIHSRDPTCSTFRCGECPPNKKRYHINRYNPPSIDPPIMIQRPLMCNVPPQVIGPCSQPMLYEPIQENIPNKESFVSGRARRNRQCGAPVEYTEDLFCGCNTNVRPEIQFEMGDAGSSDLWQAVHLAQSDQVYPTSLTAELQGYRAFGKREKRNRCNPPSLKYSYKPSECNDWTYESGHPYDWRPLCV